MACRFGLSGVSKPSQEFLVPRSFFQTSDREFPPDLDDYRPKTRSAPGTKLSGRPARSSAT